MANDQSNNQSNDLKNILSKEVIIDKGKEEEKVEQKYDPSQDMKDLMELVDSERVNITNKTWSRIEKSSRLQLLNEYIKNYILENSLEGESAKQFETIVNSKHFIDFVTTICNNCKFETAREALKEKIETFQISDFFIQFEKRQFETFQISKYGSSKNSLKFETNINLKHHPKRARKKLKHFKFSFIFI